VGSSRLPDDQQDALSAAEARLSTEGGQGPQTAPERAGLPRRRFDDLRHTAATLLLEANVNTKVVSEMLGHSQVSVTMDLYQHVTPTMQQKAADAFDDLLADPRGGQLGGQRSGGGGKTARLPP
jgi:hypothetical protein